MAKYFCGVCGGDEENCIGVFMNDDDDAHTMRAR